MCISRDLQAAPDLSIVPGSVRLVGETSMNPYDDSSDRKPTEYFLFALGFGGFMIGSGGLVLSAPGLALTGVVILLICVVAFLGSAES